MADPALEQATANEDDAKGALIQVRDLFKGFHNGNSEIEIFKGADLTLSAGETIAVVGPSGIGKSTLLHLLGTLDRPDSGTIMFNGENVFDFEPERLARFRNVSIGFVFQFHHLLPEFSAIENAMMPAFINGMSKKRASEAAGQILERVGLAERLHLRVGKLSGGEQQRVALARALVLRPMVLLADEPTGNLDRQNSEQVHAMLSELNQELGMTLVVVTHNPSLADLMSRRVTVSEGRIVDAN